MTTIRQAILKAADHIERNPLDFLYSNNARPSCGTPGCMLGWTGVFMGIKEARIDFASAAAEAIGTSLHEFIQRTADIRTGRRLFYISGMPRAEAASNAAQVMRLYADKYHPSEGIEEVRGIPDAVRNIFTLTNEQLREALDA